MHDVMTLADVKNHLVKHVNRTESEKELNTHQSSTKDRLALFGPAVITLERHPENLKYESNLRPLSISLARFRQLNLIEAIVAEASPWRTT